MRAAESSRICCRKLDASESRAGRSFGESASADRAAVSARQRSPHQARKRPAAPVPGVWRLPPPCPAAALRHAQCRRVVWRKGWRRERKIGVRIVHGKRRHSGLDGICAALPYQPYTEGSQDEQKAQPKRASDRFGSLRGGIQGRGGFGRLGLCHRFAIRHAQTYAGTKVQCLMNLVSRSGSNCRRIPN